MNINNEIAIIIMATIAGINFGFWFNSLYAGAFMYIFLLTLAKIKTLE